MKGGSTWKIGRKQSTKEEKKMHRKGEEVLTGLRVDHTESSELHVPD